MKVVTYIIEVSYTLDFEDPDLAQNVYPELTDERDIYEFVRENVNDWNFAIVGKKYEENKTFA